MVLAGALFCQEFLPGVGSEGTLDGAKEIQQRLSMNGITSNRKNGENR